MKVSFFAVIASLVMVSSASFAGQVCFSNVTQYTAVKAQLPKLLQTLPLMLGADDAILAAIRISAKGQAFQIEGYSLVMGNGTRDKQPIKNVCVDGFQIQATFASQTLNLTVSGDKVIFEGFELKKISSAQFAAYAKRVNAAMGGH